MRNFIENIRDADAFDVIAPLHGVESESHTPLVAAVEGFDEVCMQCRRPGAGIHFALDPVDTGLRERCPLPPAEHYTIFLNFAITQIQHVVQHKATLLTPSIDVKPNRLEL